MKRILFIEDESALQKTFGDIFAAENYEMISAFPKILQCDGPVYLRTGRSPTPLIYRKLPEFEIGKAEILKAGLDVSIFACGVMVSRAIEAAKILKQKGISAEVINVSTLKPLDMKLILKSVKKTGAVVSAEDHNVIGGLGGAISEFLSQYCPVPQEFVGVRDVFAESGEPSDLQKKYLISDKDIAKAAIKCLIRKKSRS